MYAYLLWIDGQGVVFPVYPWQPGNWESRPPQESAQSRIALPAEVDRGWPMTGPAGMETIVLLARESPLPEETDLRQLLGEVKPTSYPIQHPQAIVEFDDGRVVTEVADRDRAPQFFDTQQIDDPVLQTQQLVAQKLRDHFTVIRALSFANRGE